MSGDKAFKSPLLGRNETATGLVTKEYTITTESKKKFSFWRVATSEAKPTDSPKPCMIWVHGGGFIERSFKMKDVLLESFNRDLISRLGDQPLDESGCVLLYVEYDLAQEAPFPAALEEVLATYKYAQEKSRDLGILWYKICMTGVSAGGNLAWAATHMAIDSGLYPPCGLMLFYPMLDPDTQWKDKQGEKSDEDMKFLNKGWDTYLGESRKSGKRSKYTDLLKLPKEDLEKLPEIYMDVGGSDYFTEEVKKARDRMVPLGVGIASRIWKDWPHTFERDIYRDKSKRDELKEVWKIRRMFLGVVWAREMEGSKFCNCY